ncbi:hypothetical protein [Marisediminicola antarctica]|uniref:Uncharacterized protein n=1 Tax=Marisediminicola antarctica TaxID=674079 RepID=A0A7L5ALC3_9MICO|nr:hypothetical protein [Marisediminicola antarctica]QHO70124.1 hypothetical protein BHD05_11210 [Marisediminicola antarctica]
MSTATPLVLTMTEIAALAQVHRPVVSTWRARSATSEHPFPGPISQRGSQLLFDAGDVSRWLTDTGHGNNASADRDAAAHAAIPSSASFDAITALLTLRVATGRSLSGLSDAELIDHADAADPDDAMLFREVEATPNLGTVARYVDELVDAAYGEAPAFERILSTHRQKRADGTPAPVLNADGIHLVAGVAKGLALTSTHDDSTERLAELVDSTGTATDVTVEIARDERFEDIVASLDGTTGTDAHALRRIRRRLAVHKITTRDQRPDSDARQLHLAILGSSTPAAAVDAVGILSAIDEIAVQLDHSQLALIVGPSAVLSDADLDRTADEVRSGVLRSGQLRAIIRLPAGFRAGMPRQSLTLWVMGPAHPDVELADRWTMIADLSTARRDPSFDTDLISDVVASLGTHSTVRAHAFRFARLAFTRQLLARGGSLVQTPTSGAATRSNQSAVEDSLRAETLMTELGLPNVSVAPAPPEVHSARPRLATIGQRLDSRQLCYIAGNRLTAELVESTPAASGRVRVIGPDEVLGDRIVGSRSVDRLQFSSELPSGRLTEPGDVVFCTAPSPAAIVDREGLSVVQYPARILRIRPDGDDELLPDVLAADVNARSASDTTWRAWPSRGVDPRQRATLSATLDSLRDERAAISLHLARLDELESVLVDGVAHSRLTLSAPHVADTSDPSKGHP